MLDLKEYGTELQAKMGDAWELAQRNMTKAQVSRSSTTRRVGQYDSVWGSASFSSNQPRKRKFARPFHGPYRIVKVDENTAKVRRVDQPEDEPILVAQKWLRRCLLEISNECWLPLKTKGKRVTPEITLSAQAQPGRMSTAPVSEDGGGLPLTARDIAKCNDGPGALADLSLGEPVTKKSGKRHPTERENSPQKRVEKLAPSHENWGGATGKWSGRLCSHHDSSQLSPRTA